MRIKSLVYFSMSAKYRREIKKINDKIDTSIGKTCVIIGNGPSLNNFDFSIIKNLDKFVVNYFFKHNDFNNIDPNHYVIIDDAFQNNRFEPQAYEVLIKWILENSDKSLYLNYSSRNVIMSLIGYIPNNVYLIPNELYFYDFITSKADIYKYRTVNVIAYALSLAIFQGYSRILLLGLDYNDSSKHFYNSNNVSEINNDNFEQGYYYFSYLLRTYKRLQKISNKYNIEIVDLSPSNNYLPFRKQNEN